MKKVFLIILAVLCVACVGAFTACENDEKTEVTYTITYTGTDGATFTSQNPASYTSESKDFTLVNPTKDGFEFAGWTGTDLTEATLTVTIVKGSTGNKAYTATWTAKTFTLSFDSDGGSAVNDKVVTYNSAIGELDTPLLDGNKFAGWKIDNQTIYTDTVWNYLENKTAVATWTTGFVISYSGVSNTTGANNNPLFYFEDTESFTLSNPTKDGFEFAGWTGTDLTEPTLTVTITQGSTGDREYTATWTAKTYTLSFNGNGGTTPQSMTVTYGQAIGDLPTTTNGDYSFGGWAIGGVKITKDTIWTYRESQMAIASWVDSWTGFY